MNHQQFKEWLNLLAYGELEGRENDLLRDHLAQCAECRAELEQVKRLHRVMDNHAVAVSDRLLSEARQELRSALRVEKSTPAPAGRVISWVPSFKQVLAYAAVLALGLIGGYLLFLKTNHTGDVAKGNANPKKNQDIINVNEGPDRKSNQDLMPFPLKGDVQISNVKIVDSNPGDGNVRFTFEATKQMDIEGKMTDPNIQQMLTYALVKEQNAGVRLRAVNAINATTPAALDPAVRTALITAMKTDKNDGVRKEALATLMKAPMDDEIQTAVMFVLQHDANAALRIEAIKGLQSNKTQDKEMINVLRDRMKSDDNSYIRQTATRMLEEVHQQ
jgi:hypothetical protein